MADHVCLICHRPFTGQASAETCSTACRVTRSRRRKEAERRKALDLLARMATARDPAVVESLRREAERLTRD
ncbi:hypothetical protein GCM10023081_38150 [Arthrobacter ginkgonis]|uniref:DUF2116 family Zn-ribbon domain-containing protein n=1 Tax=Arthrobacter ginkgonis TaxID=1630594 RepID=A0ABP7D2V7_9MICC